MILTWCYFLLLGLFLLRKTLDQRRSRRNARALQEQETLAKPADAFPFLLITHVAFFILVPAEILLLERPLIPGLAVPMLGLFVLATCLRAWSIHSLGKYWCSRVIVPQDLKPVTEGPYRWIRHPNYLSMTLELIALSFMHTTYLSGTVVAVLCVVAVITRISREEARLLQVPAYREAMRDKARLIPGIY
jgi:methyltransferase